MDLGEKGGEVELRVVEGGKTTIIMYCIKEESIFKQKEINKQYLV